MCLAGLFDIASTPFKPYIIPAIHSNQKVLMNVVNKTRAIHVCRVLLVQVLIFVAILTTVWGSQRLYSLVDPVAFPEGYQISSQMAATPENDKGKGLLDALTFQLRREMASPLGWTGNDILFNKYVLDNRAYRQYGVYVATKTLVDHYSMVIAKLGSNDRESDELHKARLNHFSISPQKFWFPSAEGSYEGGLKLLETYKNGLDSGKSVYNCRPDDVYSAFNLLLGDGMLGYALGLLQDSQNLPFYTLDNRIYEAQGVALVVRDYVRALYTLYPEVTGKNNDDNMEKVLRYLDRIATYNPLYITAAVNSGELIISYLMFVSNRLEDIRDSIRI